MRNRVETIAQYKELAIRTIKPHDSKALAISDWALGLGGELSEVVALVAEENKDKMEMAKELGDILWYSVALMSELDLEFPSDILKATQDFASDRYHCPTCILDQTPDKTAIIEMTIHIGTVQEKIKHIIMHKEEADYTVIAKNMYDVLLRITTLSVLHGFSIYDVAELNAAKLAHRYNMKNGGGYTHAASANRHAAELKFEDTATYKWLYSSITGNTVVVGPNDVEVL